MNKFITLFLLPSLVFGQKDYSALAEKYIQAQVTVNDFSGTILILKNSQTLLNKAYGLADREWNIANTIDTKFRIGSITKQFTAISILQLVDKGKLSLADPIAKYIPDFPKGDKISIHLLLCHRSGIGDYAEDSLLNNLIKFKHSPDNMIPFIEKLPFDFEPNTSYMYSNSNYYLLGCIIEKVSGLSFHDYVHQNILTPVNLQNTGVEITDEIITKKARGYQHSEKGFINEMYYAVEILFSAGGMYSTTDDLNKLDIALKNGKLLSKESIKKMFTPYTLNDTHYGYGSVIDTVQNHPRIWHSGGGFAFNSIISRFPNDSITVIVMSNNQSNSEGIANALSAILFDHDVQVPYIHKPYAVNPKTLEKYVGKWFGYVDKSKSEIEIYIKDNKLYRKTQNATDLELIPETETKFYYSDGSDRQLEFLINKKGHIEEAWFIKDGLKYSRQRVKN